jgi:hypothetical protein
MVDFDDYIAKTKRLLERNRVTVKDIAKYTNTDVARARRIIDTLSLEYPVYEVRRGVYGRLPKETDMRPRGFIAMARARAGLSPSGY